MIVLSGDTYFQSTPVLLCALPLKGDKISIAVCSHNGECNHIVIPKSYSAIICYLTICTS